jgi:hypothetical protein
MALGRGMFQVDESFVKSNLKGLTDDDRALMDAFVGQSLHGGESADGGECAVPVKKALYRISDCPPAPGDDSPLRDGVFRNKVAQRGEFNLDGRMIATDGGRSTKLTKLFKRRDNEGKLLHELHRMKLD